MQKISNRLFKVFILLSFVFSIFSLVACSGSSSNALKLSFEQNEYQMELGEQLTIIPTIENGTVEEPVFVWKSYDTSIVSVANGTLTAKGVGKTTVKVHLLGNNNLSTSVTIKVVSPDEKPIATFNNVPQALGLDDTFQLECSFTDPEKTYDIVFNSLDEDILSVNENGLITALAYGNGAIDVKVIDSETNQFVNYRFIISVRDKYLINYELNGGINNPQNPEYFVEYGVSPKLLAPTKEGYIFKGWYKESSFENEVSEIETSKKNDITIYAKWVEATVVIAETIDESKTYKYGLFQGNKNQTLYLTGEYDGYYGKTTDNFYDAADVKLIPTEGGYNIKLTLADESVKYLNIVASGNYINIKFEDEATNVWTYNSEYNTYTTIVNEKEYYIGTYNSYNTFSPSTIDKAPTSFVGHLYEEVEYTDQMRAEDIVNNIDVLERHYENYKLPVIENVDWSLKEEYTNATIENGVLTIVRPAYGEADVPVVLVATATVNEAQATKELEVIILAKSNIEVATEIDSSKIYKFGLFHEHVDVNKYIFATGIMNGNYGATNSNPLKAADVKVVAVEGGYNLQVLVGETTKYLELVQSGKYTNLIYNDVATEGFVWLYNEEFNTFTYEFTEGDYADVYYIGAYSNFETLSASKISYASTAGSFVAKLYEVSYVEQNYIDYFGSFAVEKTITTDYELPKDANIVWDIKEESSAATLENGKLIVTRLDTDTIVTVVAQYKNTEYKKEFDITVKAKETEGGSEPASQTTIKMAAADLGLESGEVFTSVAVDSVVTITADNNSGSTTPKYYSGDLALRLYGKNTFEITCAAGYKMTKIVIVTTNNSYQISDSNCELTNATGTLGQETITLVPTDGTQPVILTNPKSSGNFRIVSAEITYEATDSVSGGGNNSGVEPIVSTETITFSKLGLINAEEFSIHTSTNGVITVKAEKGSGSTTPKYYSSGAAVRLYPKNIVTMSCISGYKITSIVIETANSGSKVNPINTNFTFENATASGLGSTSVTLTPINGTLPVTMTDGTSSSGNSRLISIVITYQTV